MKGILWIRDFLRGAYPQERWRNLGSQGRANGDASDRIVKNRGGLTTECRETLTAQSLRVQDPTVTGLAIFLYAVKRCNRTTLFLLNFSVLSSKYLS
jgi:hypothetical protein